MFVASKHAYSRFVIPLLELSFFFCWRDYRLWLRYDWFEAVTLRGEYLGILLPNLLTNDLYPFFLQGKARLYHIKPYDSSGQWQLPCLEWFQNVQLLGLRVRSSVFQTTKKRTTTTTTTGGGRDGFSMDCFGYLKILFAYRSVIIAAV